jgi:serine/threonine protein kinase
MDINNLSKKEFTDLVDKMLNIIHSDKKSNDKIKKNELIKFFCNEEIPINKNFILPNEESPNNPYNSPLYKIYPCNQESLIKEDISFLNINGNKEAGTSSEIYKDKINGKILKKSKSGGIDTLFSMLFDCLLYEYSKQPNYLCKVHEIGTYYITNEIYSYEIMDNCGENLFDFFKKIKKDYIEKINSEDNIKFLFHNVLIIFYKMIECIKILFDLGYAHLDIKPQNFVISCIDSNNSLSNMILDPNIDPNIDFKKYIKVKIIDFGTVRKLNVNITLNDKIGTPGYYHNDLKPLGSTSQGSKSVNINIKHDIYSLGMSFAQIIIILFTDIDEADSLTNKVTEKNTPVIGSSKIKKNNFSTVSKINITKYLGNIYNKIFYIILLCFTKSW